MTRRTRDDGSMLVELLVGMSLMAIIGTLVLQSIVGGLSVHRQLADRGGALADVQLAGERVSREVRNANPVVSAYADRLEIQRATNGGGTAVLRWWLAAGTLLQQTSTYDANGVLLSTGPAATVITGLDPSVAPFDYEAKPGWTAPAGSPALDARTCQVVGQTTYARECIGTVLLRLARLVPGHGPVAVTTAIDLRNAPSGP
jgi:type II secretory pathway pseudopilin PulG